MKVVQFPDDKHPFWEPLAVAQSMASAPPIAARPAVTVIAEEPADTVPVAIPNTPAPPLETNRLLDAGWEVVASPAHVMLGVLPPEENIGVVAVTAVRVPDPLLLKVVQSALARHPAWLPEAA